MQMQLLLETPESPFKLLSSVFGDSKFFSNFVLLQQMYLHRKRYFIRFSMNLVGVSLLGKDGVSILSFCFTKSLHSVDFLLRKESYISTLFLFLIVRYIPAIMVNPKILKRYGIMSPRSPVGTKVILGFLKVNSIPWS